MRVKKLIKSIPLVLIIARLVNKKYWVFIAWKVKLKRNIITQIRSVMAIINAKIGRSENKFERIHKYNLWGNKESISGPGSTLDQTHCLRNELPLICHEYKVKTVLDLPCGDYNWMQYVDLPVERYIGGDVVDSLIAENQKRYKRQGVEFQRLNLLGGDLPRVDLVVCRDCLVHFSIRDVYRALATIKKSGSTLLLTTIFTDCEINGEISTGEWRKINLSRPPFNLPPPIKVINEKCPDDWQFGKSMALWHISDL